MDWTADGRVRGEGLCERKGVPRLVSWSAVNREPLSLLVDSDSQELPSSLNSPPGQDTTWRHATSRTAENNVVQLITEASNGVFTYLIQWQSSDRRGQHSAGHIPLNWSLAFALCLSPEHLSSALRHPGTTLLLVPAEERFREKKKGR